jgi:hypothetical protein
VSWAKGHKKYTLEEGADIPLPPLGAPDTVGVPLQAWFRCGPPGPPSLGLQARRRLPAGRLAPAAPPAAGAPRPRRRFTIPGCEPLEAVLEVRCAPGAPACWSVSRVEYGAEGAAADLTRARCGEKVFLELEVLDALNNRWGRRRARGGGGAGG